MIWGTFNCVIQGSFRKGSFLILVWSVSVEDLRASPAIGRTGIEKVREVVPDPCRLQFLSEWSLWAPRKPVWMHVYSSCLWDDQSLLFFCFQISLVLLLLLQTLTQNSAGKGLLENSSQFLICRGELGEGSCCCWADHSTEWVLYTRGKQGWVQWKEWDLLG